MIDSSDFIADARKAIKRFLLKGRTNKFARISERTEDIFTRSLTGKQNQIAMSVIVSIDCSEMPPFAETNGPPSLSLKKTETSLTDNPLNKKKR